MSTSRFRSWSKRQYNRFVDGFVANTDFDWYTFLRDRQPLEEVNFWQPSGGDAFRAIEPGEPPRG